MCIETSRLAFLQIKFLAKEKQVPRIQGLADLWAPMCNHK